MIYHHLIDELTFTTNKFYNTYQLNGEKSHTT